MTDYTGIPPHYHHFVDEPQVQVPIANASEDIWWVNRNCCSCSKHPDEPLDFGLNCEIDDWLTVGTFMGTVPQSIAERMGDIESRCPEWRSRKLFGLEPPKTMPEVEDPKQGKLFPAGGKL